MEGYIAEIRMFAGNFAPRNWLYCSGQIINIASNTALFSLLGTTYGGNGQTTFGIPDLRGRVPIGAGNGPGLNPIVLGEMAGTNSVTLITSQMPAHVHAISANGNIPCRGGAGDSDNPVGNIPAASATDEIYAAPNTSTGNMAPISIAGNTTIAGGSQPFSIMQPYLGMNYIICQFGIFPSRN